MVLGVGLGDMVGLGWYWVVGLGDMVGLGCSSVWVQHKVCNSIGYNIFFVIQSWKSSTVILPNMTVLFCQ